MQEDPRNMSFARPVLPGRVNHIGLDRQIVVEKFRRARGVGEDPADLGRREEHEPGN